MQHSPSTGYAAEISEQFSEWTEKKSVFLWKRRIEAVLPHLPAEGLVLDVGCGDASAIRRFAGQHNNVTYIGTDIRKVPPGSGIVRADCQKLPFDSNKFDAAVFLAVIEHVPDQAAALQEAYRLLKKGGVLLLTTPNPLYGLPMAIAGRVGLKYKEGYDNGVSLSSLADTARGIGFRVDLTQGFLLLPFANPLGRMEKKMGNQPLLRRLLMNQFLKATKL